MHFGSDTKIEVDTDIHTKFIENYDNGSCTQSRYGFRMGQYLHLTLTLSQGRSFDTSVLAVTSWEACSQAWLWTLSDKTRQEPLLEKKIFLSAHFFLACVWYMHMYKFVGSAYACMCIRRPEWSSPFRFYLTF